MPSMLHTNYRHTGLASKFKTFNLNSKFQIQIAISTSKNTLFRINIRRFQTALETLPELLLTFQSFTQIMMKPSREEAERV